MSQVESASLIEESSVPFLPPPYQQPHVTRQFEELMREIGDVIAPVWPLKDYVAVNPYAGVSDRRFFEARKFLRLFSNTETLMSLDYFAEQLPARSIRGDRHRNGRRRTRIVGCANRIRPSSVIAGRLNSVPTSTLQVSPRAHEADAAVNSERTRASHPDLVIRTHELDRGDCRRNLQVSAPLITIKGKPYGQALGSSCRCTRPGDRRP